MKPIYLFYGFGGEYVLHPLYEELSKKGFECIEIDPLKDKRSKKTIESLQGKDIVFLTSAHFLMDGKNFKYFYTDDNDFYSVLEIISLLKPRYKVFIPHDLTQPIIDYEKEFLNQFDLFCSPCEPFTSVYSHFTTTVELGWIKYKKLSKPIDTVNTAVWFISDFILYLKMGKEKAYETLAPVLKQNVSVKFPFWPGSDEFEEYFRSKGIHVFSASENSIDIIQAHTVIVTNGLSSIIAESYFLGKTTVNITEGSPYGNSRQYLLDLFPELEFIERIEDFYLKAIDKKDIKPVLKPFEMEKMIELLKKI